jgi:glycosyltransferase involved in cell wall biosynthesis
MRLNELVTIVIPCKNEKDIILKTLDLLNYQQDIRNVKVVVCDASDDGVTKLDLLDRIENYNDSFDLYLMDGGLPARARNNGFKLVKTPYVLFIDSDVFLLDPKIIKRSIIRIHRQNLDLVTAKFRSDNGKFNYVYKTFDFIQMLSKWSTPFCLGGYMLVRSETFRAIGGFNEEIKVAEDYMGKSVTKVFSGLDLQVGGEGMKGFYDDILPKFLNKYAKKWDAKTGITEIEVGKGKPTNYANFDEYQKAPASSKVPVNYIDVTPKMRESVVTKGQPMFAIGAGGAGAAATQEENK